MVLVIDNYDSFTFNIVRYLEELGETVSVYRNDALRVREIGRLDPTHIVISPGPGTPETAGITLEVIRAYAGLRPILGVCLGHQAIGMVYGAQLVRAGRLMHGKTSQAYHRGSGLFDGLPSPLVVARYHSLILAAGTIPASLEITAWTERGEVMAICHRRLPVFGLQFHPESILGQYGHELFAAFLGYRRTGAMVDA